MNFNDSSIITFCMLGCRVPFIHQLASAECHPTP